MVKSSYIVETKLESLKNQNDMKLHFDQNKIYFYYIILRQKKLKRTTQTTNAINLKEKKDYI